MVVTGLDVIGLVLAIFPVIEELIKLYDLRPTTEQIRFLQRTVKNEEAIFRDTLEQLLSPHVSDRELQQLLILPSGKGWADEALEKKLQLQLGERRFSEIKEILEDIKQCLEKLREELCVEEKPGKDAKSSKKRALKKVMNRLKSHRHKDSVEKLKLRVQELRNLTSGNRTSPPLRHDLRIVSVVQNIRKIRQYATSVYSAISRAWTCKDCSWRCANLSLDGLSSGGCISKSLGDSRLRFRFSFSFRPSLNGKRQQQEWRDAELEFLSDDFNALATADSSSLKSNGLESHRVVKFAVPGRSSTTVIENVSKESSATLIEPVSKLQIVDSSSSDDREIQNLCHSLRSHEDISLPKKGVLGFLREEQHRFGLSVSWDRKGSGASPSFLKLKTFLSRRNGACAEGPARSLCKANRLKLACTLTTAILQLNSTPWLDERWIRRDVLYLKTVEGTTGNDMIEAYVSRLFASPEELVGSSLASSSTAVDSATNGQLSWIRNHTLYNLSLVLIELCFNRSMEDLAEKFENDAGGKKVGSYRNGNDEIQFFTAHRIINSGDITVECGKHYQGAVQFCLSSISDPNFMEDEVQQKFLTDVVLPLEETCQLFGVTL